MKTFKELLNPDPQQSFYYLNNEKVPLYPVPNRVLIKWSKNPTQAEVAEWILSIDPNNSIISKMQLPEGVNEEDVVGPYSIVDVNNEIINQEKVEINLEFIESNIASISPLFKSSQSDNEDYLIGLSEEIIVKLREKQSIEDLLSFLRDFQITSIDAISNVKGAYTLRATKDQDVLELSNKLHESGKFKYAHPNFFRTGKQSAFYPNDPLYPSEWHLGNLSAEEAWAFNTGIWESTPGKIGIMDVGAERYHPDLNILNYFDTTGVPLGYDTHGTMVAGAAAAIGNNGIGVAGMAFEAQICLLRMGYTPVPNTNTLYTEDIWIASCFGVARDVLNVHAINCSFSIGSSLSNILLDEVEYCTLWGGLSGHGILMFASTGNDFDTSITFPANHPNVMAIGATQYDNTRAPYSNYGDLLDMVAPGSNIETTNVNSSYASVSGTSFASPITTALAVMINLVMPEYNPENIYRVLAESAVKLPGYSFNQHKLYGSGNMKSAMVKLMHS